MNHAGNVVYSHEVRMGRTGERERGPGEKNNMMDEKEWNVM